LPVKRKNIVDSKIRVAKKIKIKRKSSVTDEAVQKPTASKIEPAEAYGEIVHTQQNFFIRKLEEKQNNDDILPEIDNDDLI